MTSEEHIAYWKKAAGDAEAALRKLVFAARTSGGTAGRDEMLCSACDEAERLLLRS